MGTFAGYYGDMTIPEGKRNEFNKRILYLLETFYDLLAHPRDPMRQAAVVLLQRLIERGKAEFPPPNSDGFFGWLEKRFSPARQRIRRYLAILGNLELRLQVFGF